MTHLPFHTSTNSAAKRPTGTSPQCRRARSTLRRHWLHFPLFRSTCSRCRPGPGPAATDGPTGPSRMSLLRSDSEKKTPTAPLPAISRPGPATKRRRPQRGTAPDTAGRDHPQARLTRSGQSAPAGASRKRPQQLASLQGASEQIEVT
ncbi:hypothetical protein NDU88_002931 [Pleurodeles waltl]|uniref:Uncharacterized protein n=1 Tax=Pleurodeles waltl TaxID=8319 RepID=A0AAV7MP41_PLEWA|nr:hypothetical protein NDU88_002931 [Pleurodeles waltl]